jgi:hypothetical protein
MVWLATGEVIPPYPYGEVVMTSYTSNRKVSVMSKVTPEEAAQILEGWHSVAESLGHQCDDSYDYEPTIEDAGMLQVYIGDLVKEVYTSKIWTVDEIRHNSVIARSGDTSKVLYPKNFVWVATPKMPIGKGWK